MLAKYCRLLMYHIDFRKEPQPEWLFLNQMEMQIYLELKDMMMHPVLHKHTHGSRNYLLMYHIDFRKDFQPEWLFPNQKEMQIDLGLKALLIHPVLHKHSHIQ